jgi:hypothetical protein
MTKKYPDKARSSVLKGGVMMKKVAAIIMFALLSVTLAAFAGDDPNIKGAQREGIQKAIQMHVNDKAVNGYYVLYDPVTNDVKNLQFKKLHSGIVMKDGFFVSCADFTDSRGKAYGVDFLVLNKNGRFKVVESVLHKVDGQKRKYQLKAAQ